MFFSSHRTNLIFSWKHCSAKLRKNLSGMNLERDNANFIQMKLFFSQEVGTSWPWSYGSWIYSYLCNQCLSPLVLWVWISIRARCTTLCDKVCQWLGTGRWFSPGPPVSSTNKTDCHNIVLKFNIEYNEEILKNYFC